MARSAPIIPVNAKLYRHFAIMTLGVTTCLAMFASGENRQAFEEQVARQQQQIAMRNAEAEMGKAGKDGRRRGNLVDRRRSKGKFGEDGQDTARPTTVLRSQKGSGSLANSGMVAEGMTFVSQGSTAGGNAETAMSKAEIAFMQEQLKRRRKAALPPAPQPLAKQEPKR